MTLYRGFQNRLQTCPDIGCRKEIINTSRCGLLSRVGVIGIRVGVLLALTLVMASGSYAQCSGDKVRKYENLLAIVDHTNLAFVGDVTNVEYSCLEGGKSVAFLDVVADEFWYGYFPGTIRVRVAAVSNADCPGYVSNTHPSVFREGDRYLFLCSRDWSWEKHEFENGIFAPVDGILCIGNAGGIEFCQGDYSFEAEDPGSTLREIFKKCSIPEMFKSADSVVLASGFAISNKAANFKFEKPRGVATCAVVEPLKGLVDKSAFSFNEIASFEGLDIRPLVSSGDRALLFLERSDTGEFGLLYGGKSYFVLDGDVILNNYRLRTGYLYKDGEFVMEGAE